MKKPYWTLIFLIFVMGIFTLLPNASAQEKTSSQAGTLQTDTEIQENEEKKKSSYTPEIEQRLVGNALSLGAGWKMDAGFIVLGNITKGFYRDKFSLGVTLGRDSHPDQSLKEKPYFLYGANGSLLVLDHAFKKSLDLALNLNYLNRDIFQQLRPSISAKYVFRNTPHFLKTGFSYNIYWADKDYYTQFIGKDYIRLESTKNIYQTFLSYNYQLSKTWVVSLETSYSDFLNSKKDYFEEDFSTSHQKKLQLTPLLAFLGIGLGPSYDILDGKWGVTMRSSLLQFDL